MSFVKLQSSRKAKETKTFVRSNPGKQGIPEINSTKHTVQLANTPGHLNNSSDAADSRPMLLTGIHQSLPDSLEARQSERTGRGLYAKTNYNAGKSRSTSILRGGHISLYKGSVLFSLKPAVSVLSASQLDSHCSFCANASTEQDLKRCTKCRKVRYCNAVCSSNVPRP